MLKCIYLIVISLLGINLVIEPIKKDPADIDRVFQYFELVYYPNLKMIGKV